MTDQRRRQRILGVAGFYLSKSRCTSTDMSKVELLLCFQDKGSQLLCKPNRKTYDHIKIKPQTAGLICSLFIFNYKLLAKVSNNKLSVLCLKKNRFHHNLNDVLALKVY